MTITLEAVYEDGTLKLEKPLPLKPQEKVQVTVQTPVEIQAALDAVRRTAGMIRWTGDHETLRRIAEDPEFGLEESP